MHKLLQLFLKTKQYNPQNEQQGKPKIIAPYQIKNSRVTDLLLKCFHLKFGNSYFPEVLGFELRTVYLSHASSPFCF
jgi:hypothetical protein